MLLATERRIDIYMEFSCSLLCSRAWLYTCEPAVAVKHPSSFNPHLAPLTSLYLLPASIFLPSFPLIIHPSPTAGSRPSLGGTLQTPYYFICFLTNFIHPSTYSSRQLHRGQPRAKLVFLKRLHHCTVKT